MEERIRIDIYHHFPNGIHVIVEPAAHQKGEPTTVTVISVDANNYAATFSFQDDKGDVVPPDPTWVITVVSSDPAVATFAPITVLPTNVVESLMTEVAEGTGSASVTVVDASGVDVTNSAGVTFASLIGTAAFTVTGGAPATATPLGIGPVS